MKSDIAEEESNNLESHKDVHVFTAVYPGLQKRWENCVMSCDGN